MITRLPFIDIYKLAVEISAQALEHDMQFLELVFAGVWAWFASRWWSS